MTKCTFCNRAINKEQKTIIRIKGEPYHDDCTKIALLKIKVEKNIKRR